MSQNNSGVIPSEKSPLLLFSKERLISQGVIPPLKKGDKGGFEFHFGWCRRLDFFSEFLGHTSEPLTTRTRKTESRQLATKNTIYCCFGFKSFKPLKSVKPSAIRAIVLNNLNGLNFLNVFFVLAVVKKSGALCHLTTYASLSTPRASSAR